MQVLQLAIQRGRPVDDGRHLIATLEAMNQRGSIGSGNRECDL